MAAREGELRRVTVTVVVKATSAREAEQLVRERMAEWWLEDDRRLDPETAAWPVGTLLHHVVKAESGHRAVAA